MVTFSVALPMFVAATVVVTVECAVAVTGLTVMASRTSGITVTWNDAVTVLGESSGSDALHVTVVVPTANIDPESRLHVTAGLSRSEEHKSELQSHSDLV